MSKEIMKKEIDSFEASPCSPELNKEQEQEILKDYCSICTECLSNIEILSINEVNNIIKYKCVKENTNYIMQIKDYLKKVNENKEKYINKLEDKCKKHNNKKYVYYCFDCKYHLCEECLETRNHINHRKSNLIEIKPIEEELNIVNEVINEYQLNIENNKKDKEEKQKKCDELINKEKLKEEKKLEKEKEMNIERKEKIKNYENMLKINKMIYNTYKNNNNNYYNSININTLLLYYTKNEYINDKIIKIKLKDKYSDIIDIINKKYEENKKIKELKGNNENIISEKEEKYNNEINMLIKKVNKIIYIIFIYIVYKFYLIIKII